MTNPYIIIIGTNMMSLYNHRLELIKKLLSLNYKVGIIAPRSGEEIKLENMGVKFHDTPVDNRGTNVKNDLKLLFTIIKVLRKEKPDVVLTFYTKTNIYGGLACRITNTSYIENITGLGSAVSGGGLLQKAMIYLYSQAVKSASMVFFQNKPNRKFFKDNRITLRNNVLLPGSGVSLDRFTPLKYPEKKESEFVFISRIMKDKGIEEFIEAARIIKKRYPYTIFHVIGPCNTDYIEYVNLAKKEGIIKYHGKLFDIKPIIQQSHCTVLPSYYAEGMANVLLESAACGRPVITTDMPGCAETVEDSITGYLVKAKDYLDLASKLEKFILLPHEDKIKMGMMGRKKMEQEFDRNIVIDQYIIEIQKILFNNHKTSGFHRKQDLRNQ